MKVITDSLTARSAMVSIAEHEFSHGGPVQPMQFRLYVEKAENVDLFTVELKAGRMGLIDELHGAGEELLSTIYPKLKVRAS